MTNMTYQLQYTTNLNAPDWANLRTPSNAVSGVISASNIHPRTGTGFIAC